MVRVLKLVNSFRMKKKKQICEIGKVESVSIQNERTEKERGTDNVVTVTGKRNRDRVDQ